MTKVHDSPNIRVAEHIRRFEETGDHYVLAASSRGADHHPAWYLNLLTDPYATETSPHARPATADERPHLWRLMVSAMSEYAAYQQQTTREIPLFSWNACKPGR